jgi:hypothetical protein
VAEAEALKWVCAAAVFVALAVTAGCSGDEGTSADATTPRSSIATARARPPRNPDLYEGNVARGGDLAGGGPVPARREFITGKPVGLRLRGPLGVRARYKVCVTGPRTKRCLHGQTSGSDRFTALKYPARDVGSYLARWLIGARQVAEWAYEVRPKPKPKPDEKPTETVPLRERYPELRLPRRKLR